MAGSTLPALQPPALRSDEWLTPLWLLQSLGAFDLDPSAAPEPRPWPTAKRHICRPADGLSVPWTGRVWLNPPYSCAGAWVKRLADHGCGTALVFARTDTAWFTAHVWRRASGVLFLDKRLSFCRQDGVVYPNKAGAPAVLASYGEDDLVRLRASGLAGTLVEHWEPVLAEDWIT